MKKTDVTQPVAMATPFAEGVYSTTSTDDFEIPAATSTTADDSCVMDDGFLPITSTALDDGGKAPERKNFNGMFYLSTDQRFFLQNGGFITYNPDVATAIGGYPQDAILDFIDSLGNYKKVRSLIDDNSSNFVADETLIDGINWEEIPIGGGSGYEVGDIVIRNTPTNDASKHLLDGALIDGSGSYSAFVNHIAGLVTDYPNLFVTESDWQTTVTTYGSCGKYVYDSVNNTVRLPKVSDILQGTTDLTALGDLIEAGLPNITGAFMVSDVHTAHYANGAFYLGFDQGYLEAGGSTWGYNSNVIMDASRSSSLYKNNFNKVQPQTINVLYYIVIATTTKTDIQVDIDEITTDLNGKADVDLTNVNNSGTSRSAGWAMPSNKYIDLTLGASGTLYTAPANGWVELSLEIPAYSYANIAMQTPFEGNVAQFTTGQFIQTWATIVPVVKNATFSIGYDNFPNTSVAWTRFRFIYAQGSESEAN